MTNADLVQWGLAVRDWAGPVLGALGVLCGVRGIRSAHGTRVLNGQLREEVEILLRQHQTEYRDGIAEVSRAVGFLEQSAQRSEDVLRGRMTPSLRGQAMQLLRSGMSAEKAASAMGAAKADLRLIAKVSRVLSVPAKG